MTKRDAICDAALELFAEQGIENTTIREIAARASASEGALYRHFDGKADLASWLHRRCVDELRERMAAATEDVGSPTAHLEALVRALFEFHTSRPASCTYLLSGQGSTEACDSSAPVRSFAEALRAVPTEEDEPSTALRAGWILAMVQRTVRFLKSGTLDVSDQTAIDQTVAAALRVADLEAETDDAS